MAVSYWNPDWFLTSWFPAVWFAPADETGVPPDELRPEYGGGGPDSSDTAPRQRDDDVFDEPYQSYVKKINEARAEEWQRSREDKPVDDVANDSNKDYHSHVGTSAPERNEQEAADQAAFVILAAKTGAELAKQSLGELTKASKEAIAARQDEEAALAAFAFLMLED